jgi:hypothetical protein
VNYDVRPNLNKHSGYDSLDDVVRCLGPRTALVRWSSGRRFNSCQLDTVMSQDIGMALTLIGFGLFRFGAFGVVGGLVVAGGVEYEFAQESPVAALMILMLRSWMRIRTRVRGGLGRRRCGACARPGAT